MAQLTLEQIMNSAGVAMRDSRAALQYAQQLVQQYGADKAGFEAAARAANKNAEMLLNAVTRLSVSSSCGAPDIQRIENIPGRRVPFDYVVDIPIPANWTGTLQQSMPISQDGPFVAVARMATLVSAHTYQVIDSNSQVLSFNARSFGRYRPIHSAWDINDGRPHTDTYQVVPAPGTGAPTITAPSNTSSFRSMEGDFRILVKNAGTSYPRSNQEIPSTWWTKSINSPWELGALDFFERGEIITFDILPMHPLNPAYGNIAGGNPLNPLWPFLGSQFDAVEGIDDAARGGWQGTVDPVTRNPAAILTIGFHGYRILQPPGVGPM